MMLSITTLGVRVECHYVGHFYCHAERYYAQGLYTESRYAEYHNVECCDISYSGQWYIILVLLT
jgi:hypothetical protein